MSFCGASRAGQYRELRRSKRLDAHIDRLIRATDDYATGLIAGGAPRCGLESRRLVADTRTRRGLTAVRKPKRSTVVEVLVFIVGLAVLIITLSL